MTAVDSETTKPAPAPAPSTPAAGGDDGKGGLTFEALAVVAMVIAMASILIAVFAVGLASRAIDEHRSTPAAGGGGGGGATVTMADFEFAPASISAGAGGSLAVSNEGPSVHNLIVEDVDGVGTADLNVGDSETLDLGSLEAGTYTIYCSIAGHRESGMEGTITIG